MLLHMPKKFIKISIWLTFFLQRQNAEEAFARKFYQNLTPLGGIFLDRVIVLFQKNVTPLWGQPELRITTTLPATEQNEDTINFTNLLIKIKYKSESIMKINKNKR